MVTFEITTLDTVVGLAFIVSVAVVAYSWYSAIKAVHWRKQVKKPEVSEISEATEPENKDQNIIYLGYEPDTQTSTKDKEQTWEEDIDKWYNGERRDI